MGYSRGGGGKNYSVMTAGFFVVGFAPDKIAQERQGAEKYRKPLGTWRTGNSYRSLTKYAQVIHRRSPCKAPDTALSCIASEGKTLDVVSLPAADL